MGSGLNLENIVQSMVKAQSKPGQKLQAQQVEATKKLSMFQQFRTKMTSLGTQATKLSAAGSISSVSRRESDSSVAKVTGFLSSGVRSIRVDQLAQSKTAQSSAFTTGAGTGAAGSFMVNGKSVSVASKDSVEDIATKINASGSGAVASIVKDGSGKSILQVKAGTSGASGVLDITDDTGGAAIALGLVNPVEVVAEPAATPTPVTTLTTKDGGDVKSRDYFGDYDVTIRGLVGTTKSSSLQIQDLYDELRSASTLAVAGLSVSVNGTTYGIDKAHIADSLSVALSQASGKTISINSTNPGDIKVTETTVTTATAATEPAAAVVQTTLNVVAAGKDAQITVDGKSYNSASGTFTDAIAGVKIKALKLGENVVTSTESHTNAVSGIQDFIASYNSLADFVKSNSGYDSKSYQSGDFFGDTRVSGLGDTLRKTLDSGGFGTSLSALGISFDSSGKMALDQSKLESALRTDPTAVENFFSGGESGVGVADKLKSVTDAATAYGTGSLSAIESSLQATADSLAQDLVKFQQRLSNTEQSLRSKFQAMDSAVTRANQQQTHLNTFMALQSTKSGGNDTASLFGILG